MKKLIFILFVFCASSYAQFTPSPKWVNKDDTTIFTPVNIEVDGTALMAGTIKSNSPVKLSEGLLFSSEAGDTLFRLYIKGYGDGGLDIPDAFDQTIVVETSAKLNTQNMELTFWNTEDGRPTLVLNQGGIAKASTFERSVKIGSDGVFDTTYTDGTTEGFLYIDFNTSVTGADLGVWDDIEAKGDIYAQGKLYGSNMGAWTTYTPTVTLVGGVGNVTPVYSTNSARYCRIGNLVYVDILLKDDGGAEGAGSGQINVALPITSSEYISNNIAYPCGTSDNGFNEFIVHSEIHASANTVMLRYSQAINNIADFCGVDQNNSTRALKLHFWYEVSE